ncbi:MAG: zf-TFIIB domain-containing protein [Planctomycetota bacterium]|nr:zf-TFIIB domain-containing protein [Planctomycetota bacterium]
MASHTPDRPGQGDAGTRRASHHPSVHGSHADHAPGPSSNHASSNQAPAFDLGSGQYGGVRVPFSASAEHAASHSNDSSQAKLEGPHPVDERLKCPKDASRMERVRKGKVVVDRCMRCHAMWFDALELDHILDLKDGARAIDVGRPKEPALGERHVFTPGGVVCPRDMTQLVMVTDPAQPSVKHLACTTCGGVLLEPGELLDLDHHGVLEQLRHMLGRPYHSHQHPHKDRRHPFTT